MLHDAARVTSSSAIVGCGLLPCSVQHRLFSLTHRSGPGAAGGRTSAGGGRGRGGPDLAVES